MKYLSLVIPGDGGGSITGPGGVPTGGLSTVVKTLGLGISYLLIAAILLALFFLIWGGFDWMMSGGNKQKLEQARQKIFYAVIGLVVVLLAFFIINVMGNLFGINLVAPVGGGGGRVARP